MLSDEADAAARKMEGYQQKMMMAAITDDPEAKRKLEAEAQLIYQSGYNDFLTTQKGRRAQQYPDYRDPTEVQANAEPGAKGTPLPKVPSKVDAKKTYWVKDIETGEEGPMTGAEWDSLPDRDKAFFEFTDRDTGVRLDKKSGKKAEVATPTPIGEYAMGSAMLMGGAKTAAKNLPKFFKKRAIQSVGKYGGTRALLHPSVARMGAGAVGKGLGALGTAASAALGPGLMIGGAANMGINAYSDYLENKTNAQNKAIWQQMQQGR